MKHPLARRWTLEGLDRALVYRLYYDAAANRWELALLETGEPVVTRDLAAARRARRARSAEERAAAQLPLTHDPATRASAHSGALAIAEPKGSART